jgi:antibiotic biosynthesis monooxygenase (ABM) superfamily enzyme
LIATRTYAESATAVFTRRVKPGREAEYEALAESMVEASKSFPGHLAATVLHEAGSPNYTLVYSFADQHALRAWLDSRQRRALVTRADGVADHHAELPKLTGLETWFTLPHRATIKPPPRWKMWLVSLVAIYPLVVAFQVMLMPTIKPLPLLVRSAILPLTLLTLMTFVVMPIVTRVVQPWLSRGREGAAQGLDQGIPGRDVQA